MIKKMSDILAKLKEIEEGKLAAESLTHGPTIGEMYEGLTKDLLDRSIPQSLDLRIVDGFVEGKDKKLSPQIDVMLVKGEGRPIPHTSRYIWPIENLIAVFEVKKNLYGADLEDAFHKLRTINDMYSDYIRSSSEGEFDAGPAFNAFARITGKYPRTWEDADLLPDGLDHIFHILVSESISPVRVIFGYEGYANELSLRTGFSKLIEENLGTPKGFGIGSFPNIIICRNNSLMKINGQPYSAQMVDNWWPAVVSNSENPLRLLIELIWTKLSNQFSQYFPMDDTLEMERLAPFLWTRLASRDGRRGWEYMQPPFNQKQLDEVEPTSWEPNELDDIEWTILMKLAKERELNTSDPSFQDFVKGRGRDPQTVINELVEKREIAWCDANTVRLLRTKMLVTAFTPDGESVTSHNTDLLSLWMMKKMEKKNHQPE